MQSMPRNARNKCRRIRGISQSANERRRILHVTFNSRSNLPLFSALYLFVHCVAITARPIERAQIARTDRSVGFPRARNARNSFGTSLRDKSSASKPRRDASCIYPRLPISLFLSRRRVQRTRVRRVRVTRVSAAVLTRRHAPRSPSPPHSSPAHALYTPRATPGCPHEKLIIVITFERAPSPAVERPPLPGIEFISALRFINAIPTVYADKSPRFPLALPRILALP